MYEEMWDLVYKFQRFWILEDYLLLIFVFIFIFVFLTLFFIFLFPILPSIDLEIWVFDMLTQLQQKFSLLLKELKQLQVMLFRI